MKTTDTVTGERSVLACEKSNMKEDTSAATSHKGKLIRSYSMSFKKEPIAFEETTNNRNAAKKFNVDVKQIREWYQKKADIIETCAKIKGQGKQRLSGGGRKITDEGLEELLLEWIHGRRSSGLRVSCKLIMIKAKSFNAKSFNHFKRSLLIMIKAKQWMAQIMKKLMGLNSSR